MKKVITIMAIILTVTIFTAFSGYAADKVIYGCYHKITGYLRIVNQANHCRPSELPISWHTEGVQGSVGEVIKSFYFELPEFNSSFTVTIPPDKAFVITDLVFTLLPTAQWYSTSIVDIYEGKVSGGVLKASFTIFWSGSVGTSSPGVSFNNIKEFHFNSGIPFSLGTSNLSFVCRGEGVYVLVSGYLINGL